MAVWDHAMIVTRLSQYPLAFPSVVAHTTDMDNTTDQTADHVTSVDVRNAAWKLRTAEHNGASNEEIRRLRADGAAVTIAFRAWIDSIR
jgi:hypothetical protein